MKRPPSKVLNNSIHIFCDVVDNYGDAGVVNRLAKLLANASYNVNVFTNNCDLFDMLLGNERRVFAINPIEDCLKASPLPEILIESFGCSIPHHYLQRFNSAERNTLWLNIEYLTAEEWAGDFHLTPSLLPYKNLKKICFMPGFRRNTGGVLSTDLPSVIFHRRLDLRERVLTDLNLNAAIENLWGLLFCYHDFPINTIDHLSNLGREIQLWVLHGIAHDKINEFCIKREITISNNEIKYGSITITLLPFIDQNSFDRILSLCDFAFLRGEDSPVQALALGVPLFWQRYPQEQDVRIKKIEAFLHLVDEHWNEPKLAAPYRAITESINRGVETVSDCDLSFFIEELEKFSILFKKLSIFYRNECSLNSNLIDFISNFINEEK